jgi:hypothetical protein
MEGNTLEVGLMGSSMEEVNTFCLMAKEEKENGKKASVFLGLMKALDQVTFEIY